MNEVFILPWLMSPIWWSAEMTGDESGGSAKRNPSTARAFWWVALR